MFRHLISALVEFGKAGVSLAFAIGYLGRFVGEFLAWSTQAVLVWTLLAGEVLVWSAQAVRQLGALCKSDNSLVPDRNRKRTRRPTNNNKKQCHALKSLL